ncbi:MAG: site-specific DNA-methyltransferase [Candidatus Diapherotrites archaeon]|nr:site-specific DNA-methyltransferase [Candidatus Diapherotrites archaeon]
MGKNAPNAFVNQYLTGDCGQMLKEVPDNSVNLIVTSPPYADSRKNTYGGIAPDEYVEWFLPKSKEFLRVLKPTGTFILNIKERVENGERHTYVLDLIKELKTQGWLWTEEFIWHKKNTHPGKWPNRFRDAWERCLQFNKSKKFRMYQEEVMVPVGEWSKTRLANLSASDLRRATSKVGSGFGKKIANWVGKSKVYPSNVLHMPTECGNKNHSAVFPVDLPTWFIRLFTKENDLVLDPFAGSGTTGVACLRLNRNYLMIDILSEYKKVAEKRLFDEKNPIGRSGRFCERTHSRISHRTPTEFGKNKPQRTLEAEESLLI